MKITDQIRSNIKEDLSGFIYLLTDPHELVIDKCTEVWYNVYDGVDVRMVTEGYMSFVSLIENDKEIFMGSFDNTKIKVEYDSLVEEEK